MKLVSFIDSRVLKDNISEVMINSAMDHANIVKFHYYDLVQIQQGRYNLYSYIELMDCNLHDQLKEYKRLN